VDTHRPEHEPAPDPQPYWLALTERFFEGRSPLFVVVLGVCFIAVVGMIDRATGTEIVVAPLFAMPVALVSWNLGRRWGLLSAVLATVTAIAADSSSENVWGAIVPSWNAVALLSVLAMVAFVLPTLRHTIELERARVGREEAVSEGLRRLNAAKDTLLRAVSHDLRQPLSGILGSVRTLRRGEEIGLPAQERRNLYRLIEQSGRKMDRLIDDLLDLERVALGTLRADREPVDVAALVHRVIGEVGLQDRVTVESDRLLASVDGPKVERIVENLLVNADRHTPAGTPVRVEIHETPGGIELWIEDDGPGVPDDMKNDVFEPFRQAKVGSGGVGIGLSLVRRFAELHDGTAIVQDAPGGGARFVVTLPCEVTASELLAAEVSSRPA
jgi:signal transduction histidine kinase